jgi:hypothetical protein
VKRGRHIAPLVLLVLAAACLAPSAALGASTGCRSERGGFKLRTSQLSCSNGRVVQRAYFASPACLRPCFVTSLGRTWRCSALVLGRSRPAGRLVHGRVLCRDTANVGRYARWEYRGQGA